jgi:hypothetical protein
MKNNEKQGEQNVYVAEQVSIRKKRLSPYGLQLFLTPAASAAPAAPVAAWLVPVPGRVPILSVIRVVAVAAAVP